MHLRHGKNGRSSEDEKALKQINIDSAFKKTDHMVPMRKSSKSKTRSSVRDT